MAFQCSYEGCSHNGDHERSDDPNLCFYHAPKGKKGADEAKFNEIIFRRISGGHVNFRGFVFPTFIEFPANNAIMNADFSDARFYGSSGKSTKFDGITFKGGANFAGAKFYDGVAYFRNCTFETDVTFEDAHFNLTTSKSDAAGGANFLKAKFNGETSFSGAHFHGSAIFEDAHFLGAKTDFSGTIMEGKFTNFGGSHHHSQDQSFAGTEFRAANTTFKGTIFKNAPAKFSGALFIGVSARFDKTDFDSGVEFRQTKFRSYHVTFREARFAENVVFEDNEIAHSLKIESVKLEPNCWFRFLSPNYKESYLRSKDAQSIVHFDGIFFNPFRTIFENIRCEMDKKEGYQVFKDPAILFRHCNLKDVFFTNSSMELFSFFTSAFYDQAQFTRRHWRPIKEGIFKWLPKWHQRYAPIFEEFALDRLVWLQHEESDRADNNVPEPSGHRTARDYYREYALKGVTGYRDVAQIYRALKAAIDAEKDYRGAGRLYFNEFEMKRLAYKEQDVQNQRLPYLMKEHSKQDSSADDLPDKRSMGFWRRRGASAKWFIYSIYKFIAGYGERPAWTFLSLLLSLLFVSTVFLHFGFSYNGKQVDYDFGHHGFDLWTWMCDFGAAFILALSRIVPAAYFKGTEPTTKLLDIGNWDFVLNLLSTIWLVFLTVLFLMGLKRHFKRY